MGCGRSDLHDRQYCCFKRFAVFNDVGFGNNCFQPRCIVVLHGMASLNANTTTFRWVALPSFARQLKAIAFFKHVRA